MATPEKVFKAGIQRESGWLYFLRDGNIMRARMVRGGQKKKPGEKPEVVLKTDVKRESGYLYYLDGQGDISRTLMSRGGTARKKKRSKKAAAKKPAKKAAKKAAAKKPAKKAAAKKPAKKAAKKKSKKR